MQKRGRGLISTVTVGFLLILPKSLVVAIKIKLHAYHTTSIFNRIC